MVPEAISEWKPDSAPQAMVMNTNGNSDAGEHRALAVGGELGEALVLEHGSVTRMPTASSTIMPIFMNVDR